MTFHFLKKAQRQMALAEIIWRVHDAHFEQKRNIIAVEQQPKKKKFSM
jgi:hypothetical protein